MSGDFCALWKEFLEAPTDRDVLERLKSVHPDLLDHVDECDTCLEGSASVEPDILFEALGSIDQPVDATDGETLSQMLSVSANDRQGIRDAVDGALLPALPGDLVNLANLGEDVDANRLFLALDATRMFLKSSLRRRVPASLKTLAMRSDGSVILLGETFASADALAAEIRQYAGVKAASAENIVKWLPQAARSFEHLIPGVDATPRASDGVWLQFVPWNPTSGDLFERWKPVREPAVDAVAGTERRRQPQRRELVARAHR
jgi:hypothetical protein